jgi:hypothetical protein
MNEHLEYTGVRPMPEAGFSLGQNFLQLPQFAHLFQNATRRPPSRQSEFLPAELKWLGAGLREYWWRTGHMAFSSAAIADRMGTKAELGAFDTTSCTRRARFQVRSFAGIRQAIDRRERN